MKNTFLIFLISSSFLSVAQKKESFALFSGNVKNTKETIVKLVNHNSSFKKDLLIDKNGNFQDTIFLDKPESYFFQIGKSYTSFFLKKGYDLSVHIDDNDFYKSLKYSGKGSDVNNYSVASKKLKAELVVDAKVFYLKPLDTFLFNLQKNKLAYLKLLEQTNLSNEDKVLQAKIIENDYLLTRFNYDQWNHFHTKIHPVLPSNYYDPIKNMDIDDDEAFLNDKSYRNLITNHWRLLSKDAILKDSTLDIIDFTIDFTKDLKSTKIKDQISSMLFKQMTQNNATIETDYAKILSLLTDDKMKDKLLERYTSAKETKPEMKTVGFNYENFYGGTTSLESLKGKLVYVEIWATWCGPCIKEMPALTQLIKEYKGKNIEFVSISIDTKNDYEKWRKMVPEKNVGGIQLLADKSLESDFMKAFSVGLIPRSLMLDENGRIVSSHAPRPSSLDTRKFINDLLEKNNKSINFQK
jgi:thiol-disulfide isomerase/thioredoxin